MPELRFICLHDGDTKRVITFIRHLMGLPLPGGWKVRGAICDNSGDWPNWVPLPIGWRVTRPGKNVGYLPGCAEANLLFDEPAEWTGLVKTDLSFEGSFLMRLARTRFPEDILAVGPDLRLCNGRRLNPVLSRRSWRGLYRYLHTDPRRAEFTERFHTLRHQWIHSTPRGSDVVRKEIYALNPSAIFLSRHYFERGGSFGESIPVDGEELFFADEIRSLEGKSVWLPGSVVWHEIGKPDNASEEEPVVKRARAA